jgi:hypothetical protein
MTRIFCVLELLSHQEGQDARVSREKNDLADGNYCLRFLVGVHVSKTTITKIY